MEPTWKGACLFAAAVLLALASCFRLWSQRRLMGRAAHALARTLVPCWRGWPSADPVELRVWEEYERKRVERARGGIALVSAAGACQFLVALARHRSGDEVYVPIASYAMTIFCVLATARPAAITTKTLDAGYCVAIGCLVASALLEDTSVLRHSAIRSTGLQLQRYFFLLSILALKSWLVALGVLAFGGSMAVRLASLGEASPWGIFSNITFPMGFLIMADIVLMSLVRAETRAKDSSKQLLAVQTLLDSICEVVVELGPGLRLTRHSAKLADILLQGPLRSLAGVALQEFMPDESDRERFERILGGNEAGAHGACVFHTSLRDSMGSTVAMELFAVAMDGTDGHRRQILGMREFTDVQPLRALEPATPRRRPPPAPEPAPSQAPRGTPASPQRQDLAEQGGAASSAGSPEGDAASDGSGSALRARGARPCLAPLRSTALAARVSSLTQLFDSWHVDSTCCEWHAKHAEAHKILATWASWPCEEPESRKGRGWQCQRCGIIGKHFGPSWSAKDCLVCQDLDDDMLPPIARRGLASL